MNKIRIHAPYNHLLNRSFYKVNWLAIWTGKFLVWKLRANKNLGILRYSIITSKGKTYNRINVIWILLSFRLIIENSRWHRAVKFKCRDSFWTYLRRQLRSSNYTISVSFYEMNLTYFVFCFFMRCEVCSGCNSREQYKRLHKVRLQSVWSIWFMSHTVLYDNSNMRLQFNHFFDVYQF